MHQEERQAALRQLSDACGTVECEPVRTNAWFLKRLCDDEDVSTGAVTTNLIESKAKELTSPPKPSQILLEIAATSLGNDLAGGRKGDFWFEVIRDLRGFRLNASPRTKYLLCVDGEPQAVEVTEDEEWLVADRGVSRRVDAGEWSAIVDALGAGLAKGDVEGALDQAIDAVDAILVAHLPLAPGEANPNELPDAPVIR